MHSNTIQLQREVRSGLLTGFVVKLIIPVFLLAYAYYYFTIGHWTLLALVICMGLAFAQKIEDLTSNSSKDTSKKIDLDYSDGGTFNHGPQAAGVSINARPSSHDGGSFKRSVSDKL